jgi:hypothetical protein
MKHLGEQLHDNICGLIICEFKKRGFETIDHLKYTDYIYCGEIDIVAYKKGYKRVITVEVKYNDSRRNFKKATELSKENSRKGSMGGRPKKPNESQTKAEQKPNKSHKIREDKIREDKIIKTSTNVEEENDFDDKKIDSEIKEAFLESEKEKEKKVAPKKESNFDFANSLKFESQSWLESVSMQQKIPPNEVVKKIDDFLIFLKTQEKNHENRKEFISHFVNWVSKNKKIEENGDSKSKSKQPYKFDLERAIAENPDLC